MRRLNAGNLDLAPAAEQDALRFARHYAERDGHPDAGEWAALVARYGESGASDIRAYLRMAMMSNLWGNTVDVLLSRLRGRPAVESSLRDELKVVLSAAVVVPGVMIGRLIRR